MRNGLGWGLGESSLKSGHQLVLQSGCAFIIPERVGPAAVSEKWAVVHLCTPCFLFYILPLYLCTFLCTLLPFELLIRC